MNDEPLTTIRDDISTPTALQAIVSALLETRAHVAALEARMMAMSEIIEENTDHLTSRK